jgi:hypothetical protein
VFWLSLAVFFTVLAIAAVPLWTPTTAALGTCAFLAGCMTREAAQYNRSCLPRLLEYWRRSFICTRCGEVFVPS